VLWFRRTLTLHFLDKVDFDSDWSNHVVLFIEENNQSYEIKTRTHMKILSAYVNPFFEEISIFRKPDYLNKS